ncbi:toxic anion resistance protein [Bacillus sp. REN3]|uniref:toxic anion resistance protein n=1 Tax=Bacillus sp. REN3 TaxID=2802440 RepID=UPI001AEE6AAF|nr:toxic anion resistance protein [Bacillus sp. REN3]
MDEPTGNQDIIFEGFKPRSEMAAGLKLALRGEPEVLALARSIDVHDPIRILEYGMNLALGISSVSDQLLWNIRKDRAEDPTSFLVGLEKILERFDRKDFEKKPRGIFSILSNKGQLPVDRLFEKYQSMGKEIEKIYIDISNFQSVMADSANMLERMHEQVYQYYLSLEKYTVAAEIKLEDLKMDWMAMMEAKMPKAVLADCEVSIEYESLIRAIDLLDQKIHQLKFVGIVALQTAQQIKLIQQTNGILVRKINSAFMTAIPIFKNGLFQALDEKRQKLAADSMKELVRRTEDALERDVQDRSNIGHYINKDSFHLGLLEESCKIIKKGLEEIRLIDEENKRMKNESSHCLLLIQEKFQNIEQ